MSAIPLHPDIVHIPIGMSVLLPLVIIAFLWAERKDVVSPRAWLFVVGLQVLIAGSSFLAAQAGEQDEEVVEHVVPESAIEAHEEWGEAVTWYSLATLGTVIYPALMRTSG